MHKVSKTVILLGGLLQSAPVAAIPGLVAPVRLDDVLESRWANHAGHERPPVRQVAARSTSTIYGVGVVGTPNTRTVTILVSSLPATTSASLVTTDIITSTPLSYCDTTTVTVTVTEVSSTSSDSGNGTTSTAATSTPTLYETTTTQATSSGNITSSSSWTGSVTTHRRKHSSHTRHHHTSSITATSSALPVNGTSSVTSSATASSESTDTITGSSTEVTTASSSTIISTSSVTTAASSTATPSSTITPTSASTTSSSSTSLVINTSMTPISTGTITSLPSTTMSATSSVTATNAPPGPPKQGTLHCGVHGEPIGDYFLARYAFDEKNVPVTGKGCYQFCQASHNITDGCDSYRFYLDPSLGVPRCDLYAAPVAYSLAAVTLYDQPNYWFDLGCGDPTGPAYASLGIANLTGPPSYDQI